MAKKYKIKEYGLVKISFKGKAGKDGKTPIKGQDYFTSADIKSIVKEIKTNIPKPKDGITPLKGVDYFTDKDLRGIVKDVLAKVKMPTDGEDGADATVDYNFIIKESLKQLSKQLSKTKEFTSEEIIKRIKGKISYEDIKDAPEFRQPKMGGTGYLREITDVEIKDPLNGDNLVYNAKTNKWSNSQDAPGGLTKAQADTYYYPL